MQGHVHMGNPPLGFPVPYIGCIEERFGWKALFAGAPTFARAVAEMSASLGRNRGKASRSGL